MLSVMPYLLDAPLVGQQMAAMDRGGHGGGFLLGGLMTAIWAALIVLLVLWIARHWSSPNNPITNMMRRIGTSNQPASPVASNTPTPLEIVQTRYAKGEINREEYETLRRDLGGEAPSAQAPSPETPSPEAPTPEA